MYKYTNIACGSSVAVATIDIFIFMLFNLQIIITKAYANTLPLKYCPNNKYNCIQHVCSIILHLFTLKLKQLFHVYYKENHYTLLHSKYLLTMKNYSTKLSEIYLFL